MGFSLFYSKNSTSKKIVIANHSLTGNYFSLMNCDILVYCSFSISQWNQVFCLIFLVLFQQTLVFSIFHYLLLFFILLIFYPPLSLHPSNKAWTTPFLSHHLLTIQPNLKNLFPKLHNFVTFSNQQMFLKFFSFLKHQIFPFLLLIHCLYLLDFDHWRIFSLVRKNCCKFIRSV